MSKITYSQGFDKALNKVFPVPVLATRAPTSSDKKYPVGQIWVRTDTAQAYIMTKLASGTATWSLASPGASDVDTLTADAGGAISPSGGNITLAGGTNIGTSGSGNTITVNLDNAISLATSVTSPIYTASGVDLNINAAANKNIIVKLGDAAGAQKISFVDSSSSEVASIDSGGNLTTAGLTFSSLLTANASATLNTAGTALNLGTDNSADAVNIGLGTAARTINIGTTAATAHVVNIGSSSAGAFSVDSAAAISLDGGAASNFSVTGAGIDLTLSSGAGRVVINGEEAAADAVRILSAAGGLDTDVALQLNLTSSQAAANAVRIYASDAAGGIDIDAGTGGVALDCTGAISFDGGAASNFSVSGAGIDLTLGSAAGRVVINGEEAAADAVRILSAAGGLDCDVALQLNLTTSQAAADAVVINASAGGVDLTAGGGDFDVAITGAINIDSTGRLQINSSGSTIDIGNDAVAQNINIGTGAAARTITVGNQTGASGLVLQSGTGEITVSGTVKEIDAEFLYSSGTDLVVSQSPILQSNANTGAAPTGAGGDINLMYLQDGCIMEQFIIGTQTIIAPRMTANGLDIALDNTASDGVEYNFGPRANAKHVYTIGTDAAFFAEATFYVQDISGCAPLMMGFRKVEANNATFANYTDYAGIGLNSVTSATNCVILTELNGGGQTATDTTDAWGGDGASQKVGIFVSSAGVVTFQVNGSAATAAPSFTFDTGDNVMFFIHFLNGADIAGEVSLVNLKIGYQA